MKEVRNKTSIVRSVRNIFVLFLLLGGFIFLFSTCEREDEQALIISKPSSDGELVTVKFELNGMNFSGDGVSIRQGITSPLSPLQKRGENLFPFGGIEGGIEPVSIPIENNMIMYATLTEDETPIMLRTAGLLNANANVRIMAYSGPPLTPSEVKQGYGDYVTSGGVFVSPLGAPLVVPSGAYRFVAYSFNNNHPLDSYAIYADTTANITSFDVLWGDTLETVGSSNSTVQIRTHHKFSRVKIVATVDASAGTRIDNIAGAAVSHVLSRLVVKSGIQHVDNPIPGSVPVIWPNTGSGSSWTSDPMPIYTNGDPPSMQIGSVTIYNGATTTVYNAGYTIPFTTPLEPGKAYTLNLRFTKCTPITGAMISASGSTTVQVNTNAATLSTSITPTGDTTPSYQWQRSLDGGNTWMDVADETGSSLDPAAVIVGITKYRVLVSNSCTATPVVSNVIDITGEGPEPFDDAIKTYVGAFWRWDQTGERLIRVAGVANAYDGEWRATVIVGDSWIELDKVMTDDPHVGWRTGANENLVANMNIASNDNIYRIPAGTGASTVSGVVDASNRDIYFRIGLKSTTGSPYDIRYGVVLLTYQNNSKSQRIFIRQGEYEDYAPGSWMHPRWCPYNLGNSANPNRFVDYPSQGGWFYQWRQNSNIPTPIHPVNPAYDEYPAPPWVVNGSTSTIDYACPAGYHVPTGGDSGSNFSTLVDNTNNQTTWGYYADGFFDRRKLVSAPESGFTDRAVHVNSANTGNGTPADPGDPKNEFVAYAGALIYNLTDNKSLFFPSAGLRITSVRGRLNQTGNYATYWSRTPENGNPEAQNIWHWHVNGAGVFQGQGLSPSNYGRSIRCVANTPT